MSAPQLTLDHLVIAVNDLERASANYSALLGRAPSWQGVHPTYGTANVLFRLPDTYIELISGASDAAATSPWLQALRQRLETVGEGLYLLALGTSDIERTVEVAREAGLQTSDPAPGEGLDSRTGGVRKWRSARLALESTRQVATLVIQHESPRGALPLAELVSDAPVVGVDHVVVASSDLAECLRVWHEKLGLDLRLTVDRPEGRRLHFLRLGTSILELAGEAAPARPGTRDLLWGVAYRVDDAGRLVDRLRAQEIDISNARSGNAPGTTVADLRPGFSHDVRTLFIEKDAGR